MRKLFWIGSPFFAPSLQEYGWDVRIHNFEHTAIFGWKDIVSLAGGEPDVVVVADKSRPPFVLGMETFPCLTVFYCVDSHIHSWYPLYAQGFDICLMSLRDHIPRMVGKFLTAENIWWFPPFAKEEDRPLPANPKWDALFVGSVNPVTTPLRARFLSALQKEIPGVHITRGNYRELYAQAKLVLNFCEFGDLNFRVFEALGCGACLITPSVEHGQHLLFAPGEDLLEYPVPRTPSEIESPRPTESAQRPHEGARIPQESMVSGKEEMSWNCQIQALADTIRHALCDEPARQRMAAHGLATVDSAHRAHHRAHQLTDHLRALPNVSHRIATRRGNAAAIRTGALRLIYLLLAENVDVPLLQKAYLNACKS